jgi:hypothetical protein
MLLQRALSCPCPRVLEIVEPALFLSDPSPSTSQVSSDSSPEHHILSTQLKVLPTDLHLDCPWKVTRSPHVQAIRLQVVHGTSIRRRCHRLEDVLFHFFLFLSLFNLNFKTNPTPN